jgi:putative aldouronate transport system substrate-binding protein
VEKEKKMKKISRITLILLAAVLMLSLAACNRPGDNGNDKVPGTDGALFDANTTITMIVPSHSSWPFDKDWKVWQYAREGTGADLQIQAIPAAEFLTKIPILFATPKDLPDMIAFTYKPDTDPYVKQGALVALDDYSDMMPNYNKFLESLSEEERHKLIRGRKAYDGKVYYAPIHGAESIQNVRAWLYRKDIFDKHGINTPKTMDELFDVASKLKELYPESYPVCMRQGFNNINVMGPSWKPYFNWDFYYDFNDGKWRFGASEDTMLEIVRYLNKLVGAKLTPPDFLTINSKTWEELVSTDRGFIMPEYQTRIDFFNPVGREANPEYNLTATEPPYVENGTGRAMVNKYNNDPKGLVICRVDDENRIKNAVKYIDWMYSDEAFELLSWGKEGETYEVVNGQRQYILDDTGNAPQVLYGVQTYGAYLRLDPEAAFAMSSKDLSATTEMALSHTEENFNPIMYLAYNDDEQAVITDVGTTIKTYVQEMLSKFILMQEPLSKWDEFQKALADLNVEEVLAAYESAYDRVK